MKQNKSLTGFNKYPFGYEVAGAMKYAAAYWDLFYFIEDMDYA